jgi:ribosomal subunit interface protein
MNIQVAVRHDTADGRIKKFVEEEFERIRVKYSPISANVVIDHEGHSGQFKTVEINVKVPGEMLHVKESSDDVNKSIDMAVKVIEKQLHKHKELHQKHHVEKPPIADDLMDGAPDEVVEELALDTGEVDGI